MKEIRIEYEDEKILKISKSGKLYTINLTTGKEVKVQRLLNTYFTSPSYTGNITDEEKAEIEKAKEIIKMIEPWN